MDRIAISDTSVLMEKECSSPQVSVSHTDPTKTTLEDCERFRFSLILHFHLHLGTLSQKHPCTSQCVKSLAESPPSQPQFGKTATPPPRL